MKRLKFVVLLAMLMALLVTGCIDMKPASEFETEDAVFTLRNGVIEVKAAKDLLGLDVFLKADVAQNAVMITKERVIKIVKPYMDGTIVAAAIGEGYFAAGETVMSISGNFYDLKDLAIETQSTLYESNYEAQVMAPVDGVYVQDTWALPGTSGSFVIGARNIGDGKPIAGFSVDLEFVTDDIEVTGIERLLPDGLMQTDITAHDNEAGTIQIDFAFKRGEETPIGNQPLNLYRVHFITKETYTLESEVFFTNTVFTWLDPEQDWQPIVIPVDDHSGYIVIAEPTLLGDFNLDGEVDDADLAMFAPNYREEYDTEQDPPPDLAHYDIAPARKAYGDPWAHIFTEADRDGYINVLDLVILAQNFDFDRPQLDTVFVKTLDELNAAILGDMNPIVFGADITGTPVDIERLVDINLNGYTLTGDLTIHVPDAQENEEMSLYAGYGGTIIGDLTVNVGEATFNNYTGVEANSPGGEINIDGVGNWNEFFCSDGDGNNLVWNAENRTLNVLGCVNSVTFNESANVTGGGNIKNAIIEYGVTVTFDEPPQNAEIPAGKVWNSRTGLFYDEIQTAINDTQTEAGDTLFVGVGTYEEQLTINVNGLELRGAQYGVDARGAVDENGWYQGRTGVEESVIKDTGLMAITADDVTIDGFTITQDTYPSGGTDRIGPSGNGITLKNNIIERRLFPAVHISDFTVSQNWFCTTEGNAIYHEKGAKNLSITDNLFTNLGHSAIILTLGTWEDVTIKGNQIDGTYSHGINLAGDSQTNLLVENNLLKNVGDSETRSGIQLRSPSFSNAQVINNTISDGFIGLQFHGNVETLNNVSIEGNVFKNNAIQVNDLSSNADLDAILDNNIFDRAVVVRGSPIKIPTIFSKIQQAINAASDGDTVEVLPGTYFESLIIDKPNLTLRSSEGRDVTTIDADGADFGIQIMKDLGTIKVEGFNIIGWNGNGLLQGAANFEGTAVHVLENRVMRTVSEGEGTCMQITGSNSRVKNNIVGGTGVIYGISLPFSSDSVAEGNNVSDCVAGIATFGGAAFGFPNATAVGILGNTVRDCMIGISVGGDAFNTVISENTVTGCSLAGLRESFSQGYGPSNTTATENNIYGNSLGAQVIAFGETVIPDDHELVATYNYWGHSSGPHHPAKNNDGQGNGVSDYVLFYPWYEDEARTILSDDFGVDEGFVKLVFSIGQQQSPSFRTQRQSTETFYLLYVKLDSYNKAINYITFEPGQQVELVLEKPGVYVLGIAHQQDDSEPIEMLGIIGDLNLGLHTIPIRHDADNVINLGSLVEEDGVFYSSIITGSQLAAYTGYGVETLQAFGRYDVTLKRFLNPDIDENGVLDMVQDPELLWRLVTKVDTKWFDREDIVFEDPDNHPIKIPLSDFLDLDIRYFFSVKNDPNLPDGESSIPASLVLPDNRGSIDLPGGNHFDGFHRLDQPSWGGVWFGVTGAGFTDAPYDGDYKVVINPGENESRYFLKDLNFLTPEKNLDGFVFPLVKVIAFPCGQLKTISWRWYRINDDDPKGYSEVESADLVQLVVPMFYFYAFTGNFDHADYEGDGSIGGHIETFGPEYFGLDPHSPAIIDVNLEEYGLWVEYNSNWDVRNKHLWFNFWDSGENDHSMMTRVDFIGEPFNPNPANGSDGVLAEEPLVLQWEVFSDGEEVEYLVEVSNTWDFDEKYQKNFTATGDSHSITIGTDELELLPGSVYYWRVISSMPDGEYDESDASTHFEGPVWSFVIK